MFVNTTYYPRNISLTWEPPAPEDRNGEIIGYSLHCWEACNNTQFVLGTNETLTSTATTFDLLCLIPNTYYNCTLSALTSIGEGPKISQLVSTSFEGTNDSAILLDIEINAPVHSYTFQISFSLFIFFPQRYVIDGGDKLNQMDAVHLLTMSVSLEVIIKIMLRTPLIKIITYYLDISSMEFPTTI